LLLLLLLLALLLFPIAVYCSVIGMINRRIQPLMVPGTWDFVGVLLATSGFLLFVGPALLSGTFRQALRELPFTREGGSIGAAVSEIWAAWWVTWLLYYGFILGGAAVLVWSRRHTTVIYNIDPHVFEMVLSQLTDRLGMPATRLGNRLFLGASGSPLRLNSEEESSTEIMAAVPVPANAPTPPRIFTQHVIIDMEPMGALRNVSLHWVSASPEARIDLERELDRALTEVVTVDNPVGGWLLGIAGFLFVAIMMLAAVFVLGTIASPRR
jgi:hypothetical protein